VTSSVADIFWCDQEATVDSTTYLPATAVGKADRRDDRTGRTARNRRSDRRTYLEGEVVKSTRRAHALDDNALGPGPGKGELG
jgi:hypothetical protein